MYKTVTLDAICVHYDQQNNEYLVKNQLYVNRFKR